MGGLSVGRVAVISDPGAIRRVLMVNVDNYQKDWLERRVLSSVLANGLLSVDGDQWKLQRRALAPRAVARSKSYAAPKGRSADDRSQALIRAAAIDRDS